MKGGLSGDVCGGGCSPWKVVGVGGGLNQGVGALDDGNGGGGIPLVWGGGGS